MILKNIQKGQIKDLQIDNLHYKIITDSLSVNLINLKSIDGLIIKSDDKNIIRRVLNQLRSKLDSREFLLPVFLDSQKLFKKLGKEIDGYILNNQKPLIASQTEKVLLRIKEIDIQFSKSDDLIDQIIQKALLFCYTREISFEPYRERSSTLGYNFPFVSSLTNSKELIEIMNRLEKLRSNSLLTAELLDKINLCSSCLGSYLNFHETCSKCSSIDLKFENLIHHFRCAYIGPESDFQQEEKLICPKCDKQLKHIGIDYDKPAEIAHCNHCTHSSQETKMKARCVDCGEHNDLQHLNSIDVRKYELTTLGANWIKETENQNRQKDEEAKDLSSVPPTIFNLLIEQEKERVKGNKDLESYFFNIKLNRDVLAPLNIHSKEKLKQEISQILKSYLRRIDIICSISTGEYHILCPDLKKKKAVETYKTVLDNLNKILSDNISSKVEVVSGELKKL